MTAMIVKRLAVLPVLLLAVAALTFVIAWVSPFDPASAYVSSIVGQEGVSQEVRDAYVRQWGLDRSLPEQFLAWLGNILTGDLGVTRMIPGQPVATVLASRAAASFALVGAALAVVLVGSLVMGALAARFRDSPLDWLVRTISYANAFAPSFWVGLMAVYVFAVWFGWLPAFGASDARSADAGAVELRYFVLPALTLALTQHGWFTLYVRNTVLEHLQDDYVRYARAQGASKTRALVRHALPNALIPYVTLLGTHLPELIGGTILVESVFGWPGLGNLTRQAAIAVDLPLLVASVLAGAVLVIVGNLTADVLYRVVDPRVREEST